MKGTGASDFKVGDLAEAATALARAQHAHVADPQQWVEGMLDAAAKFDIALTAAGRQVAEQQRAARRTPEARARRSAAAQAGWASRRTQVSTEDWRPSIPTGPRCESMDHDSTGREVLCLLDPGHAGDCDDLNGCTWTNDPA